MCAVRKVGSSGCLGLSCRLATSCAISGVARCSDRYRRKDGRGTRHSSSKSSDGIVPSRRTSITPLSRGPQFTGRDSSPLFHRLAKRPSHLTASKQPSVFLLFLHGSSSQPPDKNAEPSRNRFFPPTFYFFSFFLSFKLLFRRESRGFQSLSVENPNIFFSYLLGSKVRKIVFTKGEFESHRTLTRRIIFSKFT